MTTDVASDVKPRGERVHAGTATAPRFASRPSRCSGWMSSCEPTNAPRALRRARRRAHRAACATG